MQNVVSLSLYVGRQIGRSMTRNDDDDDEGIV